MSQVTASKNYDQLKELLFESENRKLSDLAERLDQHTSEIHVSHAELAEKLNELFQRTGDTEKLTNSVAEILADALRQAEVQDHDKLANNVAPLVVRTIKTELANSKDEMVEALYPITGRLVKAYVASAIRDLSQQLNRRIEQNTFLLRLSSFLSGKSAGEVALAHAHDFEIFEVYLIRHDTGALLARWPEKASDSHDHAMSGVLSAINAFANEALAANSQSLRQIDIGDEVIYLRASPVYMVAVRCSGNIPEQYAAVFDEAFLRALEKHNSNPTINDEVCQQTVQQLGTEFSDHLNDRASVNARNDAGMQLLKTIAALVLMPVLLIMTYSIISGIGENYYRSQASKTLQSIKELAGYPVRVAAHPFGRTMSVTGLAPSAKVQHEIGERLGARFPNTAIVTEVSIVPGSEKPHDFTPDLERLATQIKTLGSKLTHQQILPRLAHMQANLKQANSNIVLASDKSTSAANLTKIATDIANAQSTTDQLATANNVAHPTMERALKELNQTMTDLRHRLMEANAGSASIPEIATPQASTAKQSSLDEQLSSAVSSSDQLAALSSLLAIRAMTPSPPPDPITMLRQTIERKAIFFSENTDYLASADSSSTLDLIARRIKDANKVIRIVGYTDSTGDDDSNVNLSVDRARKVRQDLIGRGVSAELLRITGRRNMLPISESVAGANANRRVEFELAYDREPQQ